MCPGRQSGPARTPRRCKPGAAGTTVPTGSPEPTAPLPLVFPARSYIQSIRRLGEAIRSLRRAQVALAANSKLRIRGLVPVRPGSFILCRDRRHSACACLSGRELLTSHCRRTDLLVGRRDTHSASVRLGSATAAAFGTSGGPVSFPVRSTPPTRWQALLRLDEPVPS